MGYRQVVIRKAEKLKLKDNQLVIIKDEKNENKIPLEDINFILIEDNTTLVTTRLLAELGKYYISLIVCDEKFQPSSIMYSYNNHYKQLNVFLKQMQVSDELKSILWKKIIEQKIVNQYLTLSITSNEVVVIEKIKQFSREIELDDVTNREGLSAKMYFRSIFGSEFTRFYDGSINSALNYGYTILQSAITRSLSSFGFNTFLGIHHSSMTNNFNLPCDLMEPFRPIIDYYIYNNLSRITNPLSFEVRKELIDLLNFEVIVNNKHYTVQYAIDLVVKSYLKSIENDREELSLPLMIIDG